jgi:hypothetical protein
MQISNVVSRKQSSLPIPVINNFSGATDPLVKLLNGNLLWAILPRKKVVEAKYRFLLCQNEQIFIRRRVKYVWKYTKLFKIRFWNLYRWKGLKIGVYRPNIVLFVNNKVIFVDVILDFVVYLKDGVRVIAELQVLPLNHKFTADAQGLEHGAQLESAMLQVAHQAIHQQQIDQWKACCRATFEIVVY